MRMKSNNYRWEILNKVKNRKSKKRIEDIVNILLKNRGIKTKKQKEEFLNPSHPKEISLKSLSLSQEEIKRCINRIKKAINDKEHIIIYGDYDTDGVCATAILWECLYSLTKNVHPYIPSRFEEGYGLNPETIQNLKLQNPNLKLIITVDNGIVAYEAVEKANKLGIDVVITDHHLKGQRIPKAYSIIHTTKLSGSGLAWILAREISRELKGFKKEKLKDSLELAAIGTISDQLPLIGPNRSFAKYGLGELNATKRIGLLALFEEAGLNTFGGQSQHSGKIGTYEVNFIISPRINAMGRMEHAIDSLRLLCTRNKTRARELANVLASTNRQRQKVLDEIVLHAKRQVKETKGIIFVSHKSYHEGVIGLAASKLVEEFWRPSIVFAKGEKISKASARSIPGFNIIEAMRRVEYLTLGMGGHPMAAGFSIETDKIESFSKKLSEVSAPLLTTEILQKKIFVDFELKLDYVSEELFRELLKFEPTGIANPKPSFLARNLDIVDAEAVGSEGKHLKLVLETNSGQFHAIGFGLGYLFPKLSPDIKVDIVYTIDKENWNGQERIKLNIKDLRLIS